MCFLCVCVLVRAVVFICVLCEISDAVLSGVCVCCCWCENVCLGINVVTRFCSCCWRSIRDVVCDVLCVCVCFV